MQDDTETNNLEILELVKSIRHIKDFYNIDKRTRYILDKTVFEKWLKSDAYYVNFAIDTFALVKEPNRFIVPVDALEELSNEGHHYITEREVLKFISRFFTIIQVDPDRDMKHHEAVMDVYQKYTDNEINTIVLTEKPELYPDSIKKITCKDLVGISLLFHGMMPEFSKLWDAWSDEINEN